MKKERKGLPSSVFLLLGANMLPLLGVLFADWNLVEILFAYWVENVVIGFFSLLKMIFAQDDTRGWLIIFTIVMKIIGSAFFIVHFGGFTAIHGVVLYAFVVNYLIKGERAQIKGNDPMFEPYRRVIVMHLTLTLGTGLVIFLGQPFFMLLFFVILKTGVDLLAHLKQRKRYAVDLKTSAGH